MKWLAFLFLILIIVIVILADLGRLPGFLGFVNDIPYGDKIGHFILMGILSFLVNASLLTAFPRRDPKRLILVTSLMLAFLVGIEEWAQRFFPSRISSLLDLSSSLAGIALFALLALWWKARREKKLLVAGNR